MVWGDGLTGMDYNRLDLRDLFKYLRLLFHINNRRATLDISEYVIVPVDELYDHPIWKLMSNE